MSGLATSTSCLTMVCGRPGILSSCTVAPIRRYSSADASTRGPRDMGIRVGGTEQGPDAGQ